jgi:hypothetical protein
MKERHSPHQTQWAAQFAVASELCKRDYQVALTLLPSGTHGLPVKYWVKPRSMAFARVMILGRFILQM